MSRSVLPLQSPLMRLASLRVLLVDDKAINQLVIDAMIGRNVAKLEIADSGFEAIDAVKRSVFDVILMDYHMPLLSGLDATRKLRELPNGAQVPIIAVTTDDTISQQTFCDSTWVA